VIARSVEKNRNPNYEQLLKKEFGMDHGADGWGFEGGKIINEMVNQLSEPDICLGMLEGLIRKGADFNQVAILANHRMTAPVLNNKPNPTCFVSGLSSSGLSELIALSIKKGGKIFVYEKGPWLLTL
jgi:hypothetical protein